MMMPVGTATAVFGDTDAPTLEDAERVARVFVEEHGVGAVLLFGSVAGGSAGSGSDLDLVAVYDDLDYTTRYQRWKELKSAARSCVDFEFDLLVTDRPEWKHRTELVRNSFESCIAATVRTLLDEPKGEVNWEKEIGMPASEQQETDKKLGDMVNALERIIDCYRPGVREARAQKTGDKAIEDSSRRGRLRSVCANSTMVVEHGLKAMIAMLGAPPTRTHSARKLIKQIPSSLEHRYSVIPETMLGTAHYWREAGSYGDELEKMSLSDEDLCELALEYTDAVVRFSGQVIEEYMSTYIVQREAVTELVTICQDLEEIRNTVDLWSGSANR